MGAEREDSDPKTKRLGTEPGLGKGANPAAAVIDVEEEEAPPPVDFDALHAALGDPVEYHELSSGPAIDKGSDPEVDLDGLEPAIEANGARVGESSGRSSATYSSARPHTIPPTRAPLEDPHAPAVIVATDTDTVPSAPPQMTVPLGAPPPFAGGPPSSNPHVQASHSPSGPHGVAAGHPGSGPHAASNPFTPQQFPVQPRGVGHMTMRMPERPVNPRRGKTPTIVMRPRGPSAKQKLVAFMAMLLLVTACGIAVIIWRKPMLLGLDPLGLAPAPATSAATSPPVVTSAATGTAPAATPTMSGAASASSGASPVASPSASASAGAGPSAAASGSAAPGASVKKVPLKAPPPAPHPAGSVLR